MPRTNRYEALLGVTHFYIWSCLRFIVCDGAWLAHPTQQNTARRDPAQLNSTPPNTAAYFVP